MYAGRTTTTVSAPAHGPLDYNSLRPSFGQLAPLFGLMIVAVFVMAIGGLFIYWAWPTYGAPSGLQMVGLVLGGLLVLAGLRFFWPLSITIPDAIKQYYAMVYAWHDAELLKYEQSDGMMTAHQISEWTYSTADMRQTLMLAAWLMIAQPKSLSIEKLTKGPLLLNLDHRSFKMLDFTQDGAAEFLNMLAAAGIIQGRGARAAGTINILDPRTAAVKLLKEAAKNPAVIGVEDMTP